MITVWSGTIEGEARSKANGRKIAHVKDGFGNTDVRVIKNAKALSFADEALWQLPKLNPLIEGDLAATFKMYYRTNRPDLDPSLVLDVMQGRIYKNDRQVREMHLYHFIDKARPRVEIVITRRYGP